MSSFLGEHLPVVGGRHLESELVGYPVQQPAVGTDHSDQLDLAGPADQVGDVRGHRPRTGADHACSEPGHQPPFMVNTRLGLSTRIFRSVSSDVPLRRIHGRMFSRTWSYPCPP